MDLAAMKTAPAAQRIEFIKRDRWIRTTQAAEAEWHIQHAFTYPDTVRGAGALVWGPPNSGKSAILSHCMRTYGQQPGQDASKKPAVLWVKAPDEAEKPQMIEAILRALDPFFTWHGRRQGNSRSLERDALGGLQALKPRALIFDDLSNLAVAGGRGQGASLNFLRRLSGSYSLVCAGTNAVHSVLAADQQLRERFAFIQLGALEPAELRAFVVKYVRSFPLRNETAWTEAMFEHVQSATGGLIGRVVILLKAAAILSVEEGDEAITQPLLASPRAIQSLAATEKLQAARRLGRAVA